MGGTRRRIMGEAHASQAQASQTQVFPPHRTAVLAPRQRAGPQRADQRPALDVAAAGPVLAASAVAAGARALALAEDPDACRVARRAGRDDARGHDARGHGRHCAPRDLTASAASLARRFRDRACSSARRSTGRATAPAHFGLMFSGGASTAAPKGSMQDTWPVTGLISAVLQAGACVPSELSAANADPAHSAAPSNTATTILCIKCFLSMRQVIGNNLKPVVLICSMTTLKQHRDTISMLGRLRSLIGVPQPLRQSKVPQPGARPKEKTGGAPRAGAHTGFGQRGRSTPHR